MEAAEWGMKLRDWAVWRPGEYKKVVEGWGAPDMAQLINGACLQAWWLDFNPSHPHWERTKNWLSRAMLWPPHTVDMPGTVKWIILKVRKETLVRHIESKYITCVLGMSEWHWMKCPYLHHLYCVVIVLLVILGRRDNFIKEGRKERKRTKAWVPEGVHRDGQKPISFIFAAVHMEKHRQQHSCFFSLWWDKGRLPGHCPQT